MTRTRALTFLLLLTPAVATFSARAIDQWRFGTNGSIVVAGLRRTYLLHVPRGLDSARPVPLVISLHGAALRTGWQRRIEICGETGSAMLEDDHVSHWDFRDEQPGDEAIRAKKIDANCRLGGCVV